MRTMVRTAVIVLLSFLMAATLAVLPANAASAQAVAERQAIAKLLSASGIRTAATVTPSPAAPTRAGGGTTIGSGTPVVKAAAVVKTSAGPLPARPAVTVATTVTPKVVTSPKPATTTSPVPSTTSPTTASLTVPANPVAKPTTTNATAVPVAPTVVQGAPNNATAQATSTYSLSAAAKSFLTGLHLSLGTGVVSGTLRGNVLTVSVGAPALPVTLPIGGQTLAFSNATLTIDKSTDTLSLSASAVASGGIGGSLTATITHVSTTTLGAAGHNDLSATVAITGLSVMGTTVNLSGTLAYTGGKPVASLTGALAADAVVASGKLTVKSGSTVTLSTATGLSFTGSAVLGSGPAAFTVGVTGAIKDLKNWSLTVDSTKNTPTFSPVVGLTLNPSFSGTITDTKGQIGFDVSGNDVTNWQTGPVTLALSHVEVSNQAVPAGLSCPAATNGQIWFDLAGKLIDSKAGIDVSAEACVVPAAKAFKVSATAPSNLLPGVKGFSVTNATVAVQGQLADTAASQSASVSVTAAATLTVTEGLSNALVLPITVSFSSDGTFVASGTVDLATLKLGASGTGTLVLASADQPKFDPTTVGSKGDPFDLPAGITVLVAYTPTAEVAQALSYLKLPVPTSLTARATLSTSGFAASIDIPFGAGDQGAKLFAQDTPGGAAAYVNNLSLGINLNAVNASITVAGSAYLVIPAFYPGSSSSAVEVTLGGSLGVTADSVSVAVRFDIAGVNGPWTDAFGIPGLSVDEVAGQIGVEDSAETAGIPLPTLSFVVKNLTLPAAWANAIGMVPGSAVSLNVALDVDNPIAAISISGPTPGAVALKPFAVVKDVPGGDAVPQSVVDSVQVNTASLLFAPFGGYDASGTKIDPGATLVFDGNVAGVYVHVDGAVGLLPYPSLVATASVSSFSVGTVSLNNPKLAITLQADPTNPVADFSFSGGFTDSYTGIAFNATIDEGLSMSRANASVALHIAGGQPSYIQAGADLTGSVDSSGASFSASGTAKLVIANQNLGNVQFSYSTTGGALWQELQDNAALVAKAFQSGGLIDTQVISIMKSLKFSTDQIAWGLTYAFNESAAQLTTVFYQTGTDIGTAISEAQIWTNATDAQVGGALNQLGFYASSIAAQLRTSFSDGDQQVAAVLNGVGVSASNIASSLQQAFGDTDRQAANALNKLGYSAGTIGSVLTSVYGDGQAAVYNSLQAIGAAGSSAIDQISGFFNSGAYSPSTRPWYSPVPELLDVSGASTAPNAPVIQYHYNTGRNQQWYVLPTDSGYAELVNRNSGQCLSVVNNSTSAGAGLVQYPCYGAPNQQWYLGVYQGNSNIKGQTKVMTSRSSGLVADVVGASTSDGAAIDQWTNNGGWNQQWYFGPAVG